MWIIDQYEWRNKAIFITLLLMLAGLIFSRFILTSAQIAFFALTFLHSGFPQQCRNFFRTPFLFIISFLFFIPLISGLWSSDMQEFLSVIRVKLPFLLFPLAFACNWKLNDRQWQQIAIATILVALIGCCWSMWMYWMDHAAIHEEYLRAKTIPTPMGDDHVRYSWFVSIAVLCAFLLMVRNTSTMNRIFLMVAVIFLAIYLHVLSARTGLAQFYFVVLGFCIYLIRVNRKTALWVFGLITVLSVVAWLSFPTLKNRVKYNLYDFSHIQNNTYQSGLSDANRLISLKASRDILKKFPWGAGAGDIRTEMNNWYRDHAPEIKESDKLYPSSEWMVHANMAGWPGIILFTWIVIYPFFVKDLRYRFFWQMLLLIAGMALILETSLEIQFGVFLYTYFILWWWKWFSIDQT